MNYIHSFYSVSNTGFSTFKNQILPVTTQQAKVILIASVIFGLLATCCYAVRYCLKQRKMENHFKKVASPVKLMALSFLDAKDRESFMQVSHDSAKHIRLLALREKQVSINYLKALSGAFEASSYILLDPVYYEPSFYRDALQRLDKIIKKPIFNRPSLTFQEHQRFINQEVYSIFEKTIENLYSLNELLMLCFVKVNGLFLEHAPLRLRDDKKFVLVAVTQNGKALQYASDRLKDDKEVVLAAVTQNGGALQYASDRLNDDKEVVLAAVTQDRWSLFHASERFRMGDDLDVRRAFSQQ